MKEDKYAKSLAKNQVYTTVHIRDIRENVLPKFIKLCMEYGGFTLPWRGLVLLIMAACVYKNVSRHATH